MAGDFASTMGPGGVVGTKFTWPDPGPKLKKVVLTPDKEPRWKKWIALYNDKMLSKGMFLDLYVYGYDAPEGICDRKRRKHVLRILRRAGKAVLRRREIARA